MVIFQLAMLVYQRVTPIYSSEIDSDYLITGTGTARNQVASMVPSEAKTATFLNHTWIGENLGILHEESPDGDVGYYPDFSTNITNLDGETHGDKFHRCILVRRILRRWSNSTRIPRLKSAQVCSNVMQRATDLHRENGANKKGRAYVSLGKGSQRDM